jgi:hypothetical protein
MRQAMVLELARASSLFAAKMRCCWATAARGNPPRAGPWLGACQKGYRVRFTTAAAMVHELIEAKDEKRLLRYQKQMASYELLIVDELGFVPLSKTGAELLVEVFSRRYAMTSLWIAEVVH